jgi:hypothetical protein
VHKGTITKKHFFSFLGYVTSGLHDVLQRSQIVYTYVCDFFRCQGAAVATAWHPVRQPLPRPHLSTSSFLLLGLHLFTCCRVVVFYS